MSPKVLARNGVKESTGGERLDGPLRVHMAAPRYVTLLHGECGVGRTTVVFGQEAHQQIRFPMRIFSIMLADAGAYQTYAASVLQGGVAWDKFAPAQHIPVDAPLITCGALHTVGAVGRYGVGGGECLGLQWQRTSAQHGSKHHAQG